jgi:hypothetical protein
MPEAREVLEEYVAGGKAMQLATLNPEGAPVVCNLWFASCFSPDRLYFISRPDRVHCENIRSDDRVAGAMLDIDLKEWTQPVRGAQFTGRARELPPIGIEEQIGVYTGRWQQAAHAIDPARLATGEAHHRVYEIEVTGWVLVDEVNFKGAPRREIPAR